MNLFESLFGKSEVKYSPAALQRSKEMNLDKEITELLKTLQSKISKLRPPFGKDFDRVVLSESFKLGYSVAINNASFEIEKLIMGYPEEL